MRLGGTPDGSPLPTLGQERSPPLQEARPGDADSTVSFGLLDAAFRTIAADGNRADTARFRFGGHPVEVRCHGRGLMDLIAEPFLHLGDDRPTSPPRLRISVFDQTAFPGVCPALRAEPRSIEHHASPDGRYAGVWRPDYAAVLDRQEGRLLACVADAARPSNFQRSKPFLFCLSVWYNDRGLQTIHGAMVATDDIGILITGPGGTGKSTSSFACLGAGFNFLGDDQVAIELADENTSIGHSVFGTLQLDREFGSGFKMMRRHGIVGGTESFTLKGSGVVETVEEKTVLPVARVAPRAMLSSLQVRVVVVPRICPGIRRPRAKRMPRPIALMALVPGTMELPSNTYARCVDSIAHVVRTSECIELEVPPGLEHVPAALREWVQTHVH